MEQNHAKPNPKVSEGKKRVGRHKVERTVIEAIIMGTMSKKAIPKQGKVARKESRMSVSHLKRLHLRTIHHSLELELESVRMKWE